MSTLSTIWRDWNSQVQLNNNLTLNEAGDILQTYTRGVGDAEARQWWNAVAAEYARLNIINQPDYRQLRGHVIGSEGPANELFDALATAINSLPESDEVNKGLDRQNRDDDLAAIDPNIARIEALKTGGKSVSDRQFDRALQNAITSLEALKEDLKRRE